MEAKRDRTMSREVFRRAGWGVADQALSSLTNFALGILVARSTTPAGFGAFSIVFSTFTLLLGLSRAIASDPLMVRYSATSESRWREGVAAATGLAVTVGIALGVLSGLIGWVLGGTLGPPLLALGLTLPGLLLQDCWRFAFFASGEGRKAFTNDALCATALAVTFGALLVSGHASVGTLVLVWGAAAAVGAVAGVVQSRVRPSLRRLARWGSEHRELIPRYVGEFIATNGGGQLAVYGVGLIAGLGTLGSFRAAYLLFGPLQVVVTGVGMTAVPELVRFLRRSLRHLRLVSGGLSALLGAIALAWGTVIMLIPASLGRAVVGPIWDSAHLLATALTVGWIATGTVAGAASAIRALAAARRGLAARIVGSALGVAGIIAGVALDGARGAAWGAALAGCVESLVWWTQLNGAVRDADTTRGAIPADVVGFVARPRAVAE